MPKFSFPMPGRSRNKNKNKESERQTDISKSMPSPSVSHSGSSYSKAQRFFGTDNEINIDSPTRDDDSWMVPSSRSSVMSISISESTHSTRTTDDSASFQDSQADKWEFEGGVFPKPPRMNKRASSTILGVRYEGDADSRSNMSARLRNEDSSSTLKSYYDRQTSPLSISQQTSASSARDLALRKGLPLVISKSPLLQVDSVDIIESLIPGRQSIALRASESESKKKPAKLDLSLLFPKPRSHGKTTGPSPSLIPNSLDEKDTTTPSSGRRRLLKALSKESLKSQQSTRSSQAQEPTQPQIKNPSYQVYDHYQKSPGRPNQMDQIPESRVPESRSTAGESYLKPHARSGPQVKDNQQNYSAPNAQSSRVDKSTASVPCPWETSSIASSSSQHTKGSKRTSNSNFSNADLQERSVLSLSSESEGEESDVEPMRNPVTPLTDKASRVLNGHSSTSNVNPRLSTQQTGRPSHDSRDYTKKSSKAGPFRSIPEMQSTDPRLSGPWKAPPMTDLPALPDRKHSSKRVSVRQTGSEQQQHLSVPSSTRHSTIQSRDPRRSLIAESHLSRNSSLRSQTSQKSDSQPTPPLSPSSMEFRVDPDHSNRFMAVTKQEEALLEALRQKRARMREQNMDEPETHRSPPRTAAEIKATRYSETSSVSTYRGSVGQSKQTVLMVMDTPVSDAHRMYTAEPSPDLSDFLGFGSEEDSTPRACYITPQRQGAPRPDSFISPTSRVPPPGSVASSSTVRLSAVGSGYRLEEGRSQSVRKKTSSVRFTEDTRNGSFNEEDDEHIWGM